MRMMKRLLLMATFCVVGATVSATAQTTEFTFQGSLNSGGTPANGNYDFEFLLFDAIAGGGQLGSTLTRNAVAVSAGVFSVRLDFGDQFPAGAHRWLEIRVRTSGGGGFTSLAPRSPVGSTPYAVRSLNASTANAMSPTCIGCVNAANIASVNGAAVTGSIPVASVPAGSANYIQNSISPQPSSDFNITGNGTVGGRLSGSAVNAVTQYEIGGFRILSNAGTNNLFAGLDAGAANTTGGNNAFLGEWAGRFNTTGSGNAFFGAYAGQSNTTADGNAFFGASAGRFNTTGTDNAFFGTSAGTSNTAASDNAFFGAQAGLANTTGSNNAFFGRSAGVANTTGGFNAFFGAQAGRANTTGGSNTFVGSSAGFSNSSGGGNAFFGNGAGSSNTTACCNSFFGHRAGNSNTEGNSNTFFGQDAGQSNTTASGSAYFGRNAGYSSTGGFNAFFGFVAGSGNTTGEGNVFVGYRAGQENTTGPANSFFGANSGDFNTTGDHNTIIGSDADVGSANLSFATAIGSGAVVSASNTVVLGRAADIVRVPGTFASVGGLTTNGNLTVLGNGFVGGRLDVVTLGTAGATDVCRNASNELSTCSSSLRYKSNIRTYTGGLDLVSRLRPITFRWNDGVILDVGFAAEEVAAVDPLFATFNDKGEIEGVKYKQLTTVLVNAVNEQQAEIDSLRRDNDDLRKEVVDLRDTIKAHREEIEAFRALLCAGRRRAAVCRPAR